jgi:hypothetical protein
MRITTLTLMTVVMLLAALSPAAGQGHAGGPPILGYHVVLRDDAGVWGTGELIAVSPDSLWLLDDDALSAFPLARMRRVDVRESSFSAGTALLWSLAAGLISGAALTAACESVSGDCGAVLPTVLLSWTFFGTIGGLAVQPSRYTELPAPAADQLRPYARFPQGMPDSFPSEPPVLRR